MRHSSVHVPRALGAQVQDVANLDRWSLLTVVVGSGFSAVHVFHTLDMVAYGFEGVFLDGVIPLVLAAVLGLSGPWLQRHGHTAAERRLIVGWMALFGALTGGLFGWTLSHQFLMGGDFPHAGFVTTTNITSGSLLGLVVGVYDVGVRRARRRAERERETVSLQRARLAVLNRVLRHNLRNDGNVILGTAREVMEATEGATAERAATIEATTAGLVELGEKARAIDDLFGTDVEPAATVDVGDVIEAAVDGADHPLDADEIDLTVDVPAELQPIRTDETVIRRVLIEVLENAIEHADERPVHVRLSARPTADDAGSVDGGVDITVADDGPGLPVHERESLETGRETDLTHTSGLGLWLVTWGVAALGGDVTFGESDWGGTAVRIHLPADPWV